MQERPKEPPDTTMHSPYWWHLSGFCRLRKLSIVQMRRYFLGNDFGLCKLLSGTNSFAGLVANLWSLLSMAPDYHTTQPIITNTLERPVNGSKARAVAQHLDLRVWPLACFMVSPCLGSQADCVPVPFVWPLKRIRGSVCKLRWPGPNSVWASRLAGKLAGLVQTGRVGRHTGHAFKELPKATKEHPHSAGSNRFGHHNHGALPRDRDENISARRLQKELDE